MGDDGRFCEMTEKRRGRGFGLRFAAHINNQNSESSVNLERGGDREEVLKGSRRHLLTFLRRSLYIYICTPDQIRDPGQSISCGPRVSAIGSCF